MNNKEIYLKFIKDFSSINTSDILKKFNLNSSSFYTCEYSLTNMQKITDETRKQIKKLYNEVKNDDFILKTKDDNVNFIKDLKEIGINKVCKKLKIFTTAIYSMECSEEKYKLVVNEIKQQIQNVYNKYNNT